jgi:hypothetical protein
VSFRKGLLAILSARGWRFAFDSNSTLEICFSKGMGETGRNADRSKPIKNLSSVSSLEGIIDVKPKQNLNSHFKVF